MSDVSMSFSQDKTRKTWRFNVVLPPGPDGKRPQISRRGFRLKTEAKAEAERIVREIRQGRVAHTGPLTLATYAANWLAEHAHAMDENTISNYRDVLEIYVLPWLGDLPLSALVMRPANGKMHVLTEHYLRLLDSGGHRQCRGCERITCTAGRPLSNTTVRLAHRVLSRVFADGVTSGVLGINPCSLAKPPRAQRKKLGVWSEDEAARFLSHPETLGHRLYPAWLLGIATGLRRGEIAGLRWGDINLDAGAVAIASQRTIVRGRTVAKGPKAGSSGVVPIGPVVVAALRAYRSVILQERLRAGGTWVDTDYVFVRPGGEPYKPDALLRAFHRLCGAVGVPAIRVHDLRHSCATLALGAGVHPKVVQGLLRHSSYAITMDTYSHLQPEMSRAGVEAVEGALFRAPDTA